MRETPAARRAGGVVAENVAAMQMLYTAAMLDRLRLFDVVDRLVELFLDGRLPLGRTTGGRLRAEAVRHARLSGKERADAYARALGLPGGDPGPAPNREFAALWLRFLTAVSALDRGGVASRPAQEAVRKAGRDLAVNLSLHGRAAVPAARLLRPQTRRATTLLQAKDVGRAYGARDMWQLVERVAALELGGARNAVRYRTMAQAGATIICWLRINTDRLWSRRAVVGSAQLRAHVKSARPLETPTDRDLVDACAQWLAVAASGGDRVEQPPGRGDDERVLREVRTAVRRLLRSSDAFARLPRAERARAESGTVKVGARLTADALAAAGRGLVDEVDFPAFVSGLIAGTFEAMVTASIDQMKDYAKLIAGMAESLDQLASGSVSDDDARNWLSVRWPDAVAVTVGRSAAALDPPRPRVAVIAERPGAALKRVASELGLPQALTDLGDEDQEAALVRSARTRLATSRQALLSSMVAAGIDRIVATDPPPP
jgi:hypothetical protein